MTFFALARPSLRRAAQLIALTALGLCLAAPGAGLAAGDRTGPKKPRLAICKKTKKESKKRCVRVPKGVQRPASKRRQQGGPSDILPKPTDGGLGAAGFSREESAIAWASSLLGSTGYAWWCQRFVENAFNTQGRFASAWTAARSLGLRGGWAPRGTLVFFRPHSSNLGYGHVGISLGGTKMVSALSRVESTDIQASAYWRSLYAGWAPVPDSWPGRAIVPVPPPNNTTPTTTPKPVDPPATGTPVNRQALTSYDEMRPGAPHHGYFLNAWQPFAAKSNTITTLGATVGTPALTPGQPTGHQLNLRLCSNQPDVAGNCNTVGQGNAQIVNYGTTAVDIGDVAVTKGQTYWVLWFQPPPAGGKTWVTYWWGGGSTISTSNQLQALVRGYDK